MMLGYRLYLSQFKRSIRTPVAMIYHRAIFQQSSVEIWNWINYEYSLI